MMGAEICYDIPFIKLQYFGQLIWRADSLEKTLMLGKIEGRRRRRQRMRWLDGTTDSIEMSFSTLGVGDGQGGLVCCSPQGHKVLDMNGWLNKFWFYLAVYFGQVILFFWVLELSLAKPKFWRRKWQPTPVFLPGKSHGCRSLVWWPTVHRVAKSWTRLSNFTCKPKLSKCIPLIYTVTMTTK